MSVSVHERMVTALRDFAARRERPFRPEEALAVLTGPESRIEKARALSALQTDCAMLPADVGADGGATLWTLRPTARHRALSELAKGNSATEAPRTSIDKALAGQGSFAPRALDALIQGSAAPGTDLEAIAVTLDRAGPAAPGYDRLFALRGMLNRQRAEERSAAMLRSFVGREEELACLAGWIAGQDQTADAARSLHVAGLPGVGKSLLLEKAVHDARETLRPIVLTLDFDRAGLDVLDAQGFFDELSRQFGDACPKAASELRDLRLKSAGEATRLRDLKRGGHAPSIEVLRAMAETARQSRRSVLLVADTMEILRSRGETHVRRFFEHCDQLLRAGVHPLRIVTAGRGDALAPAPDRAATESIDLTGLTDQDAGKLMQCLDVPEPPRPAILRLACGNPLIIRMAAKAVEAPGFDLAEIPVQAEAEIVQGYLYRAILSRVGPPLDRLAKQALTLRSISPELLQKIVAPALKLKMTEAYANEAFDLLATHHWLVEPEPDASGRLRHRSDTRQAALRMLRAEASDATAEVHRRAAKWFKTRDPAMALYHRLNLTQWGDPMPLIGPAEAAAIGDVLADELPTAAHDALRQARGQRSDFGRAGVRSDEPAPPPIRWGGTSYAAPKIVGRWHSGAPILRRDDAAEATPAEPDPRAVRDLEVLLERGDVREAGYVFEHSYSGSFAPASRAGRAALCYFWLAGRWTKARELLGSLSRDELRRTLEEQPLLQGRVLLEMMAEFRTVSVRKALRDGGIASVALGCHEKSARIGLAGGILDFLLLEVARREAPSSVPPSLELAASLCSVVEDGPWTEKVAHALRTVADARSRAGLNLGLAAREAGGKDAMLCRMRDIAALNPYAEPLEARLSETIEPALGDYVQALLRRLTDLVRLFLAASEAIEAQENRTDCLAAEGVPLLAALGLTPDWTAGFDRSGRVADIGLLSRSAENWRALVFGRWRYAGSPPEGLHRMQGGEPDAMCIEQFDALIAEPDPYRSARAQLALWTDPSKRSEAAGESGDTLPDEAGSRRQLALGELRRHVESGLSASLAVPEAVATAWLPAAAH